MSIDLYLEFTRTVTLPSGNTELQTETLSINSPSLEVSDCILSLSPFEEQLSAYFNWLRTIKDDKFDDTKYRYILETIDVSETNQFFVNKYSKQDFDLMMSSGIRVEKVVWKGEPEYDKFINDLNETEDCALLYEKSWIGVYWSSDYESARWRIIKKISNYKKRDFDVKFVLI
jgi:hypothetical protein